MLYTTTTSLQAEISSSLLLQLANNGSGALDTVLLDKINESVVAEVDGYLRGIYTLPLTDPVDKIITQTVNEIMHYQLYKRRDGASTPDTLISLYKTAIARLKDIANRTILLTHTLAGDNGEDDASTILRTVTPVQRFPTGILRL